MEYSHEDGLYNGYGARFEFDDEDSIFAGQLAGIRNIAGFHGSSVKDLKKAFHAEVNGYIARCAELGFPPNKPFSNT